MSEFYHGLKEAAGVAEIISRLEASLGPTKVVWVLIINQSVTSDCAPVELVGWKRVTCRTSLAAVTHRTLGRVLINVQIAAGHALTLRLRHGDAFLRLRLTGHFGHL